MPIQPGPDVVIANRFRLSRLLGRGGMGSVWYATHLGLDVPCAVKFIEGEGAAHPEIQARFEREAKAAAQLRSPHVVHILDHGVCEGTPYIAMELLDGEDLGKRLARVGRMAPHELITIVTQVCRALTKAHAQGVVHRDLKPDNIFLVRDDDREIAKVLDFGIAKAAGAGTPGANTRTGAMLGTPYYMSPEQAQGTRAVDFRSDLWSLGVIVFEALAGSRPFESEALGDLLMKIIVGPIPTPSLVARDIPPGVDAWWARAAQRDPSLRYQSAKELCDSLAMVFGRSGSDVGDAARFVATPMGGALPPSHAATQQAPAVAAATGAPIAQTYGLAPAAGKGRAGWIAAAAGAVVVVGAAIFGASYAVREKTPAAAAAGQAQPSAASPALIPAKLMPDPPAAAQPHPNDVPTPPASASAAPSAAAPAVASAAPVPAAASAETPAPGRPKPWQAPPAQGARTAAPAARPSTPAPRPGEEKKAIDLGI